jgi:hypothetical protein
MRALVRWLAQRREYRISLAARHHLEEFLVRLRGLGADERGIVAAQTAHYLRHFQSSYIDLLYPSLALRYWPNIESQISAAIVEMQKNGREALVPGLMVWTHTLRAQSRIELLLQAKEMWRIVESGFDRAVIEAATFELLTGQLLIFDHRHLAVPEGFASD